MTSASEVHEVDRGNIIADARSIFQVMGEKKPGERITIRQVISCNGVMVTWEEAYIAPFEHLGKIAFNCIFHEGDRLTIHEPDSYLWSVESDQ